MITNRSATPACQTACCTVARFAAILVGTVLITVLCTQSVVCSFILMLKGIIVVWTRVSSAQITPNAAANIKRPGAAGYCCCWDIPSRNADSAQCSLLAHFYLAPLALSPRGRLSCISKHLAAPITSSLKLLQLVASAAAAGAAPAGVDSPRSRLCVVCLLG